MNIKALFFKEKSILSAQSRDKFAYITISILMLILGLIIFYPFYYTVMASISTYKDITDSFLIIIPEKLNFAAYELLFKMGNIIKSFPVTIFVTVAGTIWTLFLTTTAAYALMNEEMPGYKIIMALLIVPMFFSGGLIPYYILIRNLGLPNSIWVMILPTGFSLYYMFIVRNYWRVELPKEIIEAAYIEGANDIYILIRILLPLTKPILAAVSLFAAVGYWNEWWNALLFISDPAKQPIQIHLRRLLQAVGEIWSKLGPNPLMQDILENTYSFPVQMAAVVFTTIPIMMVYPFLQKNFTKGIMVGSVKG